MSNAHFTARMIIGINHADSNDLDSDAVTAVLKTVFREDDKTQNMDHYQLCKEALRKLHITQEVERGIRAWMQYAELTEPLSQSDVNTIRLKALRTAKKMCYILCPNKFEKAA